eukprot:10648702-Alexandrium_andersonii.AAC.1
MGWWLSPLHPCLVGGSRPRCALGRWQLGFARPPPSSDHKTPDQCARLPRPRRPWDRNRFVERGWGPGHKTQ